jgi:hypothetical protein
MAQATQQELNKFVKVVDEFKANFARLSNPQTINAVYASNDPVLIKNFEQVSQRAHILNSTINAAVGAWNVFKAGYGKVTDVTSTAIGDAIDEIRSWFGYEPAGDLGCIGCIGCNCGSTQLAGLGAIQIPAAIVITGIIATAVILNKAMSAIFVSVEASRIQRENPSVSREDAIARAKAALPSLLPGGLSVPMLAFGGLALWVILGKGK